MPNASSEQLHGIRVHAESVLAALPQSPPQQPGLAEQLRGIELAAREALRLASAPVRIGVVGEFSTGKTQLLGCLLGNADVLPVRETPSTGNITALVVDSQPGLPQTLIESYTLEYLDAAGMRECLGHFQRVGLHRAEEVRLPVAEVNRLRGIDLAAADVYRDLQEWARRCWARTDNPSLRYLLREVTSFARAAAALGPSVRGRRCPIDLETARRGLELVEEVDDIRRLNFDQLPAGPPPTVLSAEQLLTAEQVRASFPLIRRLEVRVRVPADLWDLAALGPHNALVLLDFPGLGAISSGVRDTFLCLQELAEVHAVLLLVDSRKPGDSSALDLFNTIQRHCTARNLRDALLVGISRFDQLPLENQGRAQVLERLASQEASGDLLDDTGLTEETLLNELDVLKQVVATARALRDQPHQVVVLSSLVALGELVERRPASALASPQLLGDLSRLLEGPNRTRACWKKVAEQLEATRPGAALAGWLADYARDGGLGRLGQMLRRQAAEHGLREVALQTRKVHETLRHRLAELPRPAGQDTHPRAADNSSTLAAVREALEGLAQVYTVLAAEYRQRDPVLYVRANGTPRPVEQVVFEDLVVATFAWEEWTQLLQVAQKGCIQHPALDGTIVFDDVTDDRFPCRTDDFLEPFARTLRNLELRARELLREAVPDLLQELANRVLPHRQALSPLLTAQAEARFSQAFGTNGPALLRVLRFAADPTQMSAEIVKRNQLGADVEPQLPPNDLFPLARGDDAHRVGRLFPWAPKHPRPTEHGTHQSQAQRLRNEIIEHLKQVLTQFVRERSKEILVRQLVPTFDRFVLRVHQLLGGFPHSFGPLLPDEGGALAAVSGTNLADLPDPLRP